MRKFPIFLDMSEKTVLIVGGGNIAQRRAQTLLKFGCKIKVVSPEFTKAFLEMKEIERVERRYEKGDCEGIFMVLAATNDRKKNEEIACDAKKCGALANASHDKELCDFYFPGIVTQGENVVIGVTASGEDHKKAAQMRKEIAKLIDGED